ncbi:MAG: glutathione binding-like protein [Myxococcota bacterium]
MTDFPSRWAPQHPDRIQLYSLATPNGKKAGIALEELELPYEAHRIDIMAGDQFDPEYVKINPNSKIPAILDPTGDEPITIMESGAILIHLADKAGKLLPSSGKKRSEVLQWLFFQIGSVGPMFGQFGHFYKFAKGKTDTYGEDRYAKEVTRLLGVLERQLDGREYLVDDYSVADIATFPWVQALDFYEGKERVGYGDFPKVDAWVTRCSERPKTAAGAQVCAF